MPHSAPDAAQMIPWQRFWRPQKDAAQYAYHHYLPEIVPRRGRGRTLATLEELADDVPCLVLLGDAGMGKSTTVRAHCEERQTSGAGEAEVLYVDLGACPSDGAVKDAVMGSAAYARWREGTHALDLFLDSFDECRLAVKQLTGYLPALLRSLGRPDALRLRICCRTADWPLELEGELDRIWGRTRVQRYVLAPLRRSDVGLAAQARGLSPRTFLRRVDDLRAQAFAARPLTLDMLLRVFAAPGGLAGESLDAAGLYLRGCRLLCEEDRRREAGHTQLLSADERLGVAGRVAAVLLLGGADSVWMQGDRGDVPAGDVRVGEIAGGTEGTPGGGTVRVDEAALRDTLCRGLFGGGPRRVRFAHRTYAEFLAAQCLVWRGVQASQLLDLLVSANDPERRVVPHLRALAVWVATLHPGMFDALLATDPELFLRGEVELAGDAQRRRLVDWLLRNPQTSVYAIDWQMAGRLDHPGLAEQLRAALAPGAATGWSRRCAARIARACRVTAVAHEMAALALDPSEATDLRVAAAYVALLPQSGVPGERFRPLLTEHVPDDFDAALRGCAFLALWPAHITLEDVLEAARVPHERGTFAGFFDAFWARDLDARQVATMLRWTLERSRLELEEETHDELFSALGRRASLLMHDPGVREALVAAVCRDLRDVDCDWMVPYRLPEAFRDDDARRALVEALVAATVGPEPQWIDSEPRLIGRHDAPWIAARHRDAGTSRLRNRWWSVLRHLLASPLPYESDTLLRCAEVSPAVRHAFRHLLRPVELDSPRARALRRRRAACAPAAPARPDASPRVAAERAVLRYQRGEIEPIALLQRIFPYPTDAGRRVGLAPDEGSVWANLEAEHREQVRDAARRVVRELTPPLELWLTGYAGERNGVAGARALYLLQTEEPGFVRGIPGEVWARWVPVLVSAVMLHGADADAPTLELLRAGWAGAADAYDAALVATARLFRDHPDHPFVFDAPYAALLPAGGPDAMAERVRRLDLSRFDVGDAATGILKQAPEQAAFLARVFDALLTRDPESPQAGWLLSSLLEHEPTAGWELVWKSLDDHAEVVARALAGVSRDGEALARLAIMPSERLARLLLTLDGRTAVEDADPDPVGGLNSVRIQLEHHLSRRTDPETRAVLQRYTPDLSRQSGLREAIRSAAWTPLTVQEVLSLRGDTERRLVRGADHLLSLVIESLRRLQERLGGDLPAVRDLWDRLPRSRWRPITEEEISDYIARWLIADLRHRGVVAGREVQIRGRLGTAKGQRVDVHLEAVQAGPGMEIRPPVRVVIEVKGSWNTDLHDAMKDQLADRYLKEEATRHGLYVVAWFPCPAWDATDRRRHAGSDDRLQSASQRLEAQALSLSTDGFHIRSVVLDTRLPQDDPARPGKPVRPRKKPAARKAAP